VRICEIRGLFLRGNPLADRSTPPSSVPFGVAAISIVFLLTTAYLGLLGVIMLVSPGTASMGLGAPLLSGLELAGPYMFLLMAGVGVLIGWGLLRLNNWARRAVIAVGFIGVVMLVPAVSAAAVDFRASLLWGGLGIIVRVMIVWYLYQEPVKRAFAKD
jgi:multidrug transporter EmrE-like cation transporter